MKAKVSLLKQEAEIDLTKEEVTNFLDSIVPGFVKEGGGILTDQVKFWRWKNQLNIVKKAIVKIEESSLEKQQVPLKVLSPILENSSLEEEESMQDKWANLLANAVTGREKIRPNFAEILKELSPVEATILDSLFNRARGETDYEKRRELQFSKQKISDLYSLTSEEADLIIEDLFRMNLCQVPGGRGARLGKYNFALRTTEIFELTTLGFNFVKACSWKI
jgi:hypothetical protein